MSTDAIEEDVPEDLEAAPAEGEEGTGFRVDDRPGSSRGARRAAAVTASRPAVAGRHGRRHRPAEDGRGPRPAEEGNGKAVVNDRPLDDFFRIERDRMLIAAPLKALQPGRPVRPVGSRRRRRHQRPGRSDCARYRPLPADHSARAARHPQRRRLPDPRRPHGRTQEVRPPQGPPQLPVLPSGNAPRQFNSLKARSRDRALSLNGDARVVTVMHAGPGTISS